jgi:chromosome segregation ATPase
MTAFLKALDIIPGWIWAIFCIALAAIAGVNTIHAKLVQTEYAKYKSQVAQQMLEAERNARQTETKLRNEVERIAANAQQRQQQQARRIADVDRALDGLRKQIAVLNADAVPADSVAAPVADAAATARELLGSCATEYREVAAVADQLKDQVTGLQEYASTGVK